MTEQPPSAEALTLLYQLRDRWSAKSIHEAAREIDALCERRVAAALAEHDRAVREVVRAAKAHEDAAVFTETERCAKVCDERSQWAESKISDCEEVRWATYSLACDDCAEMIRAPAERPAHEQQAALLARLREPDDKLVRQFSESAWYGWIHYRDVDEARWSQLTAWQQGAWMLAMRAAIARIEEMLTGDAG